MSKHHTGDHADPPRLAGPVRIPYETLTQPVTPPTYPTSWLANGIHQETAT